MAGTAASGGNRGAAKSREAHERDGTFRKDRHGDLRNPEPPVGRPEIPDGLDGLAAEEWHRIVDRLEQSGSLTKVDDRSIYQYSKVFAETEETASARQETAETIRILQENLDGRGKDVEFSELMEAIREITKQRQLESGYISKILQGRMACRVWLVEFGLTPASRGRVKLPPRKDEPVDHFASMQQSRIASVK